LDEEQLVINRPEDSGHPMKIILNKWLIIKRPEGFTRQPILSAWLIVKRSEDFRLSKKFILNIMSR